MLKKSKKLFYEYLSNKINDYFDEIEDLNIGNSYYLQFDKETEVNAFYNELQNLDNSSPFYDGKYKSFQLNNANENKTLIAAASSSLKVTESFLVTIRNLIKEQKGLYSNLNVLFLFCNYDLDSITNGAQNLLDKGMPLEFQLLTSKMENDIKNSNLNECEKSIIRFDVEKKLSNTFQNSIFDLEQDLSYINQDCLTSEDFNEMGLFKDNFTDDLSCSKIAKRCEKNSELFGHLAIAHNNNTAKDYVEKNFEGKQKITSNLIKEDSWKDLNFDEVNDSWNKMHQKGTKLSIESEIRVDKLNGFDCIDKPQGNSNASARIRNLIIFNSSKLDECVISIPFNTELPEKSFIEITDPDTKIILDPKNKCDLIISTKISNTTTCFKKIFIKFGNKRTINFTLNTCFIPLDSSLFKFGKDFLIDPKNIEPSIKFSYFENSLILGNQEDLINNLKAEDLTKNSYIIPFDKGIELTPSIIEDRQDLGNINVDTILKIILNDVEIPFKFTYSTSCIKQIKLNDIILKKLEVDTNVERNNKSIYLNGDTYNLSSNNELLKIKLEEEIVSNDIFFGSILDYEKDNKILKYDIAIPEEIKNSYLNILDFFNNKNSCPILAQVNNEILDLYKKHIQNYISFFERIREIDGYILNSKTEEDLILLGSLMDGSNTIRFTSLNIVSILQQYHFYSELFNNKDRSILEKIPSSIYANFNGLGLLPLFSINKNFFHNTDKETTEGTFNSISENQSATWIKYTKIDKKVEDESNRYLDRIVKSKLSEFRTHYSQLFDINKKLPLVINAIKLGNNLEFLKGILSYIKTQWLHKKDIEPISVIVNFYSDNNDTGIFDYFLGESDLTNITQHLPFDLFVHRGYDEREILRLYQHSIKYFHYKIDKANLKNAHLTFINRDNNDKRSAEAMSNIPTGISLNGLITSISSRQPQNNEARFGFGLGGLTSEMIKKSTTIKTAKYLNEYAYSQALNTSYSKEQCLVMIPSNTQSNFIDSIYDYSEWVTFINPHFGVDYFYNTKDLMIIHYSDQLQNSENYDAITVTKKVDIFRKIIKEELKGTKPFETITEKQVDDFITLTTCINGNWLLNLMICDNDFKNRASFSEIATYKTMMAFLQHKDILWIPISLEEILRIAGDQRIGDESIFSDLKKEMEKEMKNKYYSDDILMIGIENSNNNEKIKIHIYPVEVKASESNNFSNLENKGIKQANNTSNLLEKALIEFTNEKSPILKKFYKQFFMNLTLINAKLLALSKTIDLNLDQLNQIRGKLLNNDFIITKSLNELIGKGCVTIFSSQNAICSFQIQKDNIAILNFPLDYMRNDVLNSVDKIRDNIVSGKWDTIRTSCLSENYTDYYKQNFSDIKPTKEYNLDDFEEENLPVDEDDQKTDNLFYYELDNYQNQNILQLNEKESSYNNSSVSINKLKNKEISTINNQESTNLENLQKMEISNNSNDESIIPMEKVRIFLGTDRKTGTPIYWEYGNSDLANHHAIVTGTSGQGKSYALQCMLLEFSKNYINSIIIDYSDSFVDGKLEPIFKNTLISKNKFKQFNIYKSGLRINPFKKGAKTIGGEIIKDGPEDVAARFANIICKIYKLGDQQFSAIYKAVKEGIKTYGDNMTLAVLKDFLTKNNSSHAKTVISKLELFFDKDPFVYNNPIDWNLFNKRDGVCYLFELEGYSDEMRQVLSDFILWDLYYYKSFLDGENIPLPIVLDEVQNLSRGKKSPTYKILNEGRKHKIGGIFVTQELMSRFDTDTVNSFQNSSEKIFFTPPEKARNEMAEILSYADKRKDKKAWAETLSNNPKRSCFVNGLIIDSNKQSHSNNVSNIQITRMEDRLK